MVTAFIDGDRERFGVEPICRVLAEHGCPIAPSTYYAARNRPPCPRALRDEQVLAEIRRVHTDSGGRYGARKIYHQLRREAVVVAGAPVARCTVERLMAAEGLAGVRRGRQVRTTRPDTAAARPPDLVKREFTADAPNRLWVVDFTYVATWSGFVYVAFATDVHHSDAGSQYTAIRYTDRLCQAGALASIGSVGDSYDNALAESVIGLYKTELVFWEGPWKGADDLELATLTWVDWFNHTRLHSALGYHTPVETETGYYQGQAAPAPAGGLR